MIPFAELKRDETRKEKRSSAKLRALGRLGDRRQADGRIRDDIWISNLARVEAGLPAINPKLPPPPEYFQVSKLQRIAPELARDFVGPKSVACAEPLIVETDAHRVHRAYRLLDRLRPISRNRTAQCRRFRLSKTIQAFVTPDGKSVKLAGLCSCNNVWGCPVCSLAIQIERGGEIEYALDQWIGDSPERVGPHDARAYMFTGTLRHNRSHSLEKTLAVVTEAWSWFFSGSEGKKFRRLLGVKHVIRALESTYGESGWHPHLHCVLMTDRTWSFGDLKRIVKRWRWALTCTDSYKPDMRPTLKRAVKVTDLRKGSDGKYLQKMFFELTSTANKEAGNGNLSYWQVAERAANGDPRYASIWIEAQNALFGKKQITWSHGSKKAFGIWDLTDEMILDEDGIDATPLAETLQIDIPGDVWDDGWRRDPLFGSKVIAALRHAAETGDHSSLLALLSLDLARQGGGRSCAVGPRELCARS
jgi:hypothetical protein